MISRTRELYGEVDPIGFYEAMREVNPSPYMYLLEHDDLTVVGISTAVLREVSSEVPTLGVCLGLEAAVYAYGVRSVARPIPSTGRPGRSTTTAPSWLWAFVTASTRSNPSSSTPTACSRRWATT